MSGGKLALEAVSAGAAAFGGLAWVSVSPTSRFWGPVHCRSSGANSSSYALTFDDGPTRDSTAAVLDVLGELGASATFFVVGRNVQRCPELVARMTAEGHIVANHSLDHDHLSMFRGRCYWTRQLRETDEMIERIIGRRPLLFRPPMGVKTCFVMRAAADRGQAVITWTRRAMDGITTTPQHILRRLVPRISGGDIVVLHDGVEPHSRRKADATVAAIRPLILQLRQRGLEPSPLDQFLNLPAYAEAPAAAP